MSEPMPGVVESVEELAGVHREIQAAEGEVLMETKDLTVRFGGLVALDSGELQHPPRGDPRA